MTLQAGRGSSRNQPSPPTAPRGAQEEKKGAEGLEEKRADDAFKPHREKWKFCDCRGANLDEVAGRLRHI